MENDLFILDDTNMKILDNVEIILDKYKDMSKRKYNFGAIPKKYAQICSTLGSKQLIKHPTRITCHTSTLIDHIITNCEEKVTQRVLSTLHYLTISLFFGLGKSRE